MDGYCITFNIDGLENGSYYYNYEQGLILKFQGEMNQKIANLVP